MGSLRYCLPSRGGEFDHITSLLSAGLLERQLSRMENNGQRLSFKLSLYGVISLLN